jgi:hypothetical protein
MRFRIQELEFEVSQTEDLESEIEALKKEIHIRDRTIEARDKDLVLGRQQAEEARAQALESEKTLDRVLTNLTEANEAKAALIAWVAEVQLEKDSLAVDKQALSEKETEAYARHKKHWKNSHHYKSKSKRLKKQLALVPWLRGLSWGRGSNWGFENLRTMLLHPEVFEVDLETVTPDLIGMPEIATYKLQTLGVEFFPDVEDWTEDAPNPYRDDLTTGPFVSDCTPGKEETEQVEVGDDGDSARSPNL